MCAYTYMYMYIYIYIYTLLEIERDVTYVIMSYAYARRPPRAARRRSFGSGRGGTSWSAWARTSSRSRRPAGTPEPGGRTSITSPGRAFTSMWMKRLSHIKKSEAFATHDPHEARMAKRSKEKKSRGRGRKRWGRARAALRCGVVALWYGVVRCGMTWYDMV